MKKKLVITMMMAIISVSILACGSKAADLPTDNEVAGESPTPEQISEDLLDSNVESVDSIEETANIEDTEKKEYTPTWYMDFEGIKNNELGVMIRKDKVDLEELGFIVNYGICTSRGNSKLFEQQVFRCNYYEGDLDSYIAESSGEEGINIEKHEVNGVSFAFKEGGWFEGQKTVAFVGNGIIVYTDFNNLSEDIDNYINRINLIQVCNENTMDCLAYIADDGIHCPALGINFSCDENENVINVMSVRCMWPYPFRSVSISDESKNGMGTMFYMVDTRNAQEVVDKYVEESMKPDEYKTIEYSAIDGTVELDLGRCKYLGRGLIGQYEWSDSKNIYWLFYSDETAWSISFDGEEGDQYEDYISIIEKLDEAE